MLFSDKFLIHRLLLHLFYLLFICLVVTDIDLNTNRVDDL